MILVDNIQFWNRGKLAKNQSGFSAVELLVILFILSIAFIAFAGLFITIKNTNMRAKMATEANRAAFSKLQEYENKSFDDITVGNIANSYEVEDFSPSLSTRLNDPKSGKVFVESVTPTLKLVKVQVNYFSGIGDRPIHYSTYIQQSGVGR